MMTHLFVSFNPPPSSPAITYLLLESPLAPFPQSTLMFTVKGPPVNLHKYIPAPMGRQEQSGCIRKVADFNPRQKRQHPCVLLHLCLHVKFMVQQCALVNTH